MKLPHGAGTLHTRISAYYSSKRSFSFVAEKHVTVREWLKPQSLKEQYEFGLKILKELME